MEAWNIKHLDYFHKEENWKRQLQILEGQRNETNRATYSGMQLSKITIQGAWKKYDQKMKSRKIEYATNFRMSEIELVSITRIDAHLWITKMTLMIIMIITNNHFPFQFSNPINVT